WRAGRTPGWRSWREETTTLWAGPTSSWSSPWPGSSRSVNDRPDVDAIGGEVGLGLGDSVIRVVEDRRRQEGVGVAGNCPLDQVIERADSPAGDHRDRARPSHGARELEIVAVSRAVAVHGGEQQLSRPQPFAHRGPGEGVETRRRAAPMGVHLEPDAPPASIDSD